MLPEWWAFVNWTIVCLSWSVFCVFLWAFLSLSPTIPSQVWVYAYTHTHTHGIYIWNDKCSIALWNETHIKELWALEEKTPTCQICHQEWSHNMVTSLEVIAEAAHRAKNMSSNTYRTTPTVEPCQTRQSWVTHCSFALFLHKHLWFSYSGYFLHIILVNIHQV